MRPMVDPRDEDAMAASAESVVRELLQQERDRGLSTAESITAVMKGLEPVVTGRDEVTLAGQLPSGPGRQDGRRRAVSRET